MIDTSASEIEPIFLWTRTLIRTRFALDELTVLNTGNPLANNIGASVSAVFDESAVSRAGFFGEEILAMRKIRRQLGQSRRSP